MNRRKFLAESSTGMLLGITGCLGESSEPGQDTEEKRNGGEQSGSSVTVNDAQLDLEKYEDPERALDDGYENREHCIDGYGIPFVNTDITDLSWNDPRVLLYQQSNSSEYELLGVEWLLSEDDVDEQPTLFGGEDEQSFHEPMDGHYPGQPRHYGLHGWLFTDNPNGQFALTNTNISCPE